MSNTSNQNQLIYKSRKNVLEIMSTQGYDTEDYDGFSINDVNTMETNNQMDMFMSSTETDAKT